MPHYRIRLADPQTDNQALCALSKACPQGGSLRFYHLRDDHWARCRHYDESQVWLAELDGEIVGAGSLAFKNVWLRSRPERVAYLFDKMVHPSQRRTGIARALLRRQLEAARDAALQYCLVLEENEANRRLLETEGFIAHRQPLLYLALLPALARRRVPDSFHLVDPIILSEGQRLDENLRPRYAFIDESAASGSGLFLVGAARPTAAAVLYRHGPKVVTQAPWHHQLLGRVFSFVPRVNQPVITWELGHIWADGDRELADLLAGVAAAAYSEKIPVVLLSVYANDPHLPALRHHTVNRWGIPPTRACLYLRGTTARELLESEQPFLASPRDG